jgi:hypothetical protein
MSQKQSPFITVIPILGIFFKLLIPSFLLFFVIWQSVTYAKMNREVRKLSLKKEELFKKNYDLKAKIASTYAADRVENLYNQKYNPKISYSKDRVITLTLPQEKLFANPEE